MDHGTPNAPSTAEAVLRFLASVGRSSEAEFYLRLFRSRAAESFATIAVEAAAIEHNANGVAADLRFLRMLGLTPVVIVGLDDHARAADNRDTLAALLRQAGIPVEALAAETPAAAVRAAVEHGNLPLLAVTQGDEAGNIENLARLLTALATHKLIFLSSQGGLRLRGERLSVVNLSTDYDALLASADIDERQRRLLTDCRRLIFELVPHPLLVSLASPLNLFQELFTVKGAGTMLRRGAVITRHDGYSGVDIARLQDLLAASFGRAPTPDFFARAMQRVYVEQAYRGAALVATMPLGAYLSKFAVTREAQGEGIGQDLWSALIADCPSLIWRARNENPIRAWYERHCHGRFQQGMWTVYVRGIEPDQVPAAISFALAQPVDM